MEGVMVFIRGTVERLIGRFLMPLVTVAARVEITPNAISTGGFVGNLTAAVLIFFGHFILGGIMVWLAGLMDMLDGKVARFTHRESVYGAVYDATLDRVGEIAIYTGIGAYLIVHGQYISAFVAVIATGGSLLISYVRARAESYNIPCAVGVLCRGERVFLIGLALILNFLSRFLNPPIHHFLTFVHLPHRFPPMPVTLIIFAIAILSPVTIAQRLLYIKEKQQLKGIE